MANEEDHGSRRRGFQEIARSLLDRTADYTDARLELAKLETEEARIHLRGLSARLGFGALMAISGYAICLTAGIALVSRRHFGGHWEIPALIAGGLHLAVGTLFLLGARRQAKLSANLFRSTRREITKDQLWLKQNSTHYNHPDAPN